MFETAIQLWSSGEWLSVFSNPQKRLFWGYLLSALLIALLWLMVCRGQNFITSLRQIFSRETWLSASARADYLMTVINMTLMTLVTPKLLTQSAVAYLLFENLHLLVGARPMIVLPSWMVAVSFTLCLFILDDLARYLVHRLLHRVPVLWAFHKVHHSATVLNPMTVLRTHPVESIIYSIRNALVQGFCIAIFFFFFGEQVSLVTVLGAAVFNFMFNFLGSNLRHSPVAISFNRRVESFLISPAQHQIHHSIAAKHYDRNFGVALATWDYLFETITYSKANQKLKFGVSSSHKKPHSLLALYWSPFTEILTGLVIVKSKPQHKSDVVAATLGVSK
jgi:sterol desaturase/sphingolipid hydroxylase (fatty acid hydroxylase superfamily)